MMLAMVLRLNHSRQGLCRRSGLLFVLAGAAVLILATPALATVAWSVSSIANPTYFSPNDAVGCERENACDQYQLVIRNVGDTTSSGAITWARECEREGIP